MIDNENEYIEINGQQFKIPDIALGKVPPPKMYMDMLREEAREQRELRRFIITTIIGAIAAVASVVAATASIIACLI